MSGFGWCLSLGKMFGIKMDIHWSTLLIVYLIVQNTSDLIMERHPECSGVVCFAISVVMAILFLASILAHELTHARVGQHFGIGFTGITLFALGGIAKMDTRIPNAKSEFFMASAGPLMSLLLGVLCIALWIPDSHKISQMGVYGYFATVMYYIGIINIILAVFNMLPFQPLDGGRVLRSIVWGISKNYRVATLWCANIGRLGAILFASCGFAMVVGASIPFFGTGVGGGIWLGIIAFFLYQAATSELKMLEG